MRLRFGGLWRALLDWLFRPVHFPDDAEESLRKLSERGTVVYVGRGAGLLPYLYFNWAFLRLGLPLARYVNGVGAFAAGLFGRGLKPDRPAARAPSGTAADEARLEATVARDHPALVFLWHRGPALSGRKDTFGSDHAAALVRLQREQERPIFLVPTLLLFGQRPKSRGARPGVFDIVFGNREAPGRVRALLAFLRYRRTAWVKLGDPVDLKALVGDHGDQPDARLGRMVRGSLAQYLAREERVVIGPPLKDPKRLQMELLRDHRLDDRLVEIARAQDRRVADVRREARRDLREIGARYAPSLIAILDRVLGWVFHRIYDGIDVDEAGLARVAEAAKAGPLVLCPSHRSHVDYLVLSWVFYRHGLMPPHIAAGKNLSFWPLGPLLRRAGAFFLRRSFKDDPVYSAVFRAYVKKLLREGYSQEFFIEGTRSRTGKMLPPRLGMVSYEVEAFLECNRRDAAFVPIAISYTRVIEAKSYRAEGLGAEKRPENVRGLLAARKILRARYGRIFIRFGEPIALAAFLQARGLDPEAAGVAGEPPPDPATVRGAVRDLAFHVAYGIDRSATVLPTTLAAAGLLTQRRRGLELEEVLDAAGFFGCLLRQGGQAPLSPELTFDDAGRLDTTPVAQAVDTLVQEGVLVRHQVSGRTILETVPEGRMTLDYYKNSLVAFLGESGLIATALLARRGPDGAPVATPEAEVRAGVGTLSRLLSREFVFRPGLGLDAAYAGALGELTDAGWVHTRGKRPPKLEVTAEGEVPLARLRLLVLNLVEGYWLTLRAAAEMLAGGAVPEKELVARILEEGRVLVLTGRVAAPEALAKPLVQAALGTAVDRGLLAREGRRGERLAAADLEAVTEMVHALEPFVGQVLT